MHHPSIDRALAQIIRDHRITPLRDPEDDHRIPHPLSRKLGEHDVNAVQKIDQLAQRNFLREALDHPATQPLQGPRRERKPPREVVLPARRGAGGMEIAESEGLGGGAGDGGGGLKGGLGARDVGVERRAQRAGGGLGDGSRGREEVEGLGSWGRKRGVGLGGHRGIRVRDRVMRWRKRVVGLRYGVKGRRTRGVVHEPAFRAIAWPLEKRRPIDRRLPRPNPRAPARIRPNASRSRLLRTAIPAAVSIPVPVPVSISVSISIAVPAGHDLRTRREGVERLARRGGLRRRAVSVRDRLGGAGGQRRGGARRSAAERRIPAGIAGETVRARGNPLADVNGVWLHGVQLKVTTVVAGFVNHELVELAELDFEGVATAVEEKGRVLQIISGLRVIVEVRVLNEGLRASIMNEHAYA